MKTEKYILVDGGCYESGGCVAASDVKLCSALRANCKDKHYILNPEWKSVVERLQGLTKHDINVFEGKYATFVKAEDVDALIVKLQEDGEG